MKLTANKQSVAHKPGEYNEVSAVKILVLSSKSVKRISEIAKLTIDVDNNMLICDACSTDASVRLRCGAGLFNYDFGLGIDFAESNPASWFYQLKKIHSKTHSCRDASSKFGSYYVKNYKVVL